MKPIPIETPRMSKCNINISELRGSLLLQISGAIDEDFAKPDLPQKTFSKVIFDLDKVDFINSLGIRNWVQWIREVEGTYKDTQFFFQNCPVCIVNQLNMLKGFLPSQSKVTSLYVPFFCEECESSEEPLLVLGGDIRVSGSSENFSITLPEVKCNCGAENPMEVDIPPRKYFRFIGFTS